MSRKYIMISIIRALLFCLLALDRTECLVFPAEVSSSVTIPSSNFPSAIDGSFLLSVLEAADLQAPLPFSTKQGFQKDQVVRVLDANTVKLQKNGIVVLAGVRMPTPGSSNFQLPDCMTNSPTYKIRQLLPSKSDVLVKVAGNRTPQNAIIVRSDDSVFVNEEILKAGYGKLQKAPTSDLQEFLDYDALKSYQEDAKAKGLGIFKRCEEEASATPPFEAQFEPLELTVETKWGEDGGKQVIRKREDVSQGPPANPGDIKGCSDFRTYEDALSYFEYYQPFYGDVAKLDRDNDGIPCPGLPHTKVQEKYRMKIPNKQTQGI